MREHELTIASAGADLAASFTPPDGRVRGGLVPLHPASDGSRGQFLFEHLVDTVVPRGLAVLRYDRRSSSDGDDIPFAVQAEDALEALRVLRAQPDVGEVPLGLWAWSQGAWAAAVAAARSPEISFLVLLAACGVSPAEQMRYGTAEQLRRHGYGDDDALKGVTELRVALEAAQRDPGRHREAQAVVDRYAERPWFELAHVPRTLEGLGGWTDMDFDPAPVLAQVRCPVLLFYGEEDEWTPLEPSIAAWQNAAAVSRNADLKVVRLAGTDHAPTHGGRPERDAISPEYTSILSNWIELRLGGP